MGYYAAGNRMHGSPPTGYLPIEEHGIVGDLRTVALVGTDGTVDWYCPSRFDAPSLFGALLDSRKGGYFSLSSHVTTHPKQMYLPDTNMLLTRFHGAEAVGEVIDFMVPETSSTRKARDLLVRQARAVRGRATFELACHPAFDYGRAPHTVEVVAGVGAVFESPAGHCVLRTTVPLKIEESGVAATFTLDEGESVDVQLEWRGEVRPLAAGETADLFTLTSDFWQNWVSQSRYRGRWRETVQRSALALKLLVYHPTGALVAAPTTPLPEELGGGRNWDYRYSWLRDAAFTVYALMTLGFLEEAASFMEWVQARCESATRERDVMIMYAVDGSEEIPESGLDHLEGYRGSRPVRIGAELTSDSLIYRYAITGHDGLDGGEGTFNLCSFWYVEALTRAGRVREARTIFEKMLTYSNHLGLYAEQIGASGEALGNFPQAFTHLALISAAVNLDRALDRR